MIIPERSRDIGDFLVGRLLPFRKKRMIGPFIFVDHMGPVTLGPERYMDVGQHPHIGLATPDLSFEGSLEHRDGLGTRQQIDPGLCKPDGGLEAGSPIPRERRSTCERVRCSPSTGIRSG